jgi:predicted  nucleic acid-binding Zn-ribbon protein
MVETMGGELGLQVLQAVQGLGPRIDKLEKWMERLGMEFVHLRTDVQQLREESQQTRAELQLTRVEIQQTRAEIHEVRTELRAEIHEVRTELKQTRRDMEEGFRQVNGRMDRVHEAMTLGILEQGRHTAERFSGVDRRLQALEAR